MNHIVASGDYDKALVKFTRANEKCRFGNDEDGAVRAEHGMESAEQMRGAWSEVIENADWPITYFCFERIDC